MRALGKGLGVSRFAVDRALQKALAAQQTYYEKLQARGREILDTLPPRPGS